MALTSQGGVAKDLHVAVGKARIPKTLRHSPVSYTHLDVYKRQIFESSEFKDMTIEDTNLSDES